MAQKKQKKQTRSDWIWIATAGTIILIPTAYFLVPGFKAAVHNAYDILTSDDDQRIKQWVEKIGWWGPAAITIAMTA